MIRYDSHSWKTIFRLKGSVFPKASGYAFIVSLCAASLKLATARGVIGVSKYQDELNSAIFSGFTFTLGFILVFRTGQCYSRFLTCAQGVCAMRAELHEAALCLTSFSRQSKRSRHEVDMFVHKVVRLISLLHACALECVTAIPHKNLPIVDLDALPSEQLEYLYGLPSNLRVEVIYQWLNSLMVESMSSGMMTVPAPIFTRVFQQLEKSKMEFSQVQQLILIPFPFPYAQAAKMLLAIYSGFTPVVMIFWSSTVPSAFVFTFFSTFGMFCIEIIATEIEHPFGEDANDLPVHEFQDEINSALLLMMEPLAQKMPELSEKAKLNHKQLSAMKRHRSFYDVVEQISTSKSDESIPYMKQDDSDTFVNSNPSITEPRKLDELILGVTENTRDAKQETLHDGVTPGMERQWVPETTPTCFSSQVTSLGAQLTWPEQWLEQQVCVNRDLLRALQQIVDRLSLNPPSSDRPSVPASTINHAPSLLLSRDKLVHERDTCVKQRHTT